MIIGIILAAGKGTRLKSTDRNKVTMPFLNKPLVVYAVELMEKAADKTIVVLGAFHESVKAVLDGEKVVYAYQENQLGTGHALSVALDEIARQGWQPSEILVGYGDHTMFYKEEDINNLIKIHKESNSVMSMITTIFDQPERLHWGRIIRDDQYNVIDSIEEKDASEEQKKVTELNAGFYCFDYRFVKEVVKLIPCSSVSKEYYINSLVKIAVDQKKKVAGLKISFASVGIGINTMQEISESEKIYLEKQ